VLCIAMYTGPARYWRHSAEPVCWAADFLRSAAAASLEAQSAEASATVAQLTTQLEKAGAETMNMRQAMAVMKQQARCTSSPTLRTFVDQVLVPVSRPQYDLDLSLLD